MSTSLFKIVLAISWSLAIASCATAPPGRESDEHSFGRSKHFPVEVCKIEGKEQYLARLACESGDKIEVGQRGSVGPRTSMGPNPTDEEVKAIMRRNFQYISPAAGEPDYHIVDAYPVRCGAVSRWIYLDMYHCDKPVPDVAPKGFTLKRS